METDTDTNKDIPSPKWTDYNGLTEHIAADFANIASLPDAQIKNEVTALFAQEQDMLIKTFALLKETSPNKAAKIFGVSEEVVQGMSAEEMMERLHQEVLDASEPKLRRELTEGQQKFAAFSAGKNAEGDSG